MADCKNVASTGYLERNYVVARIIYQKLGIFYKPTDDRFCKYKLQNILEYSTGKVFGTKASLQTILHTLPRYNMEPLKKYELHFFYIHI